MRRCIQKFPDWVDNETTAATINNCWEATQRVMAAKLTTLTHKIAIQLQLLAESCTICNSRCRRPVRKRLDAPSYTSKIVLRACRPVSTYRIFLVVTDTTSQLKVLYQTVDCKSWWCLLNFLWNCFHTVKDRSFTLYAILHTVRCILSCTLLTFPYLFVPPFTFPTGNSIVEVFSDCYVFF